MGNVMHGPIDARLYPVGDGVLLDAHEGLDAFEEVHCVRVKHFLSAITRQHDSA